MQFWGDIVDEHPELITELPDDVTALEWGYEADHPFEERAARYAEAGVRFRLCPGTSGWNTIGGRVDNALTNCERAVDAALGAGAEGVLLTDWGDNGHWQPLPVSLPAMVRTGTSAWAPEPNRDLDIDRAVATVTGDATRMLGRYLEQLGTVYRRSGLSSPNSTPLFWLLRLRKAEIPALLEWTEPSPSAENATVMLREVDDVLAGLAQSLQLEPPRPERLGTDTTLVELQWVVEMLRAAANRGVAVLGRDPEAADEVASRKFELIAGHRAVWDARNRPGGQADSVRRLRQTLEDL